MASSAHELPDFAALVTTNAPAVVNISTSQTIKHRVPRGLEIPDLPEDSPFYDFFRRFLEDEAQPRDARSLGSGFVVSSDGFILTSAHVIVDASEILVRFRDRLELNAEVVGLDKRSDVALLKVDAKDLPVVKIGDSSKLAVGEWVLAIGSPFGFESTATAGIVSAKGRSLPNENYVPFIQTDVAINPGNSGGPLFNLQGEVVGINAQIYSRTGGFMGLSFAVPIDIAIRVMDQLKADGKVTRGWLGVLIQNVTRDLAESFGMIKPTGALVSEILPDSPAANSDLKPGDIIVAYDGKVLEKMADLPPLVGVTPIGKAVPLEVIRQGESIDVSVTIGELPGEGVPILGSSPPPREGVTVLGMTVQDLSQEQKTALQIDHGVIVTEVGPGPAQQAGIARDDVIIQIQGKDVTDTQALRDIVADLPDKSVPVLIKRESRSTFLALRKEEME
ncbi:DegQ family serine endoprotease [Gammaproteobacteria bacterium]|nr:DegQ family serine endoprotease [Gammaproteobacteria bacterium]